MEKWSLTALGFAASCTWILPYHRRAYPAYVDCVIREWYVDETDVSLAYWMAVL